MERWPRGHTLKHAACSVADPFRVITDHLKSWLPIVEWSGACL